MTVLAAGPLQPLDAALQGYWAKKYTPNWTTFLDSVPNAVAGQAVCLPILVAVAVVIAWRRRTWHPVIIVVAAEAAFYGGIGGMKLLLGRTAPAAGEGAFWQGGAIEHGWYGIAYPSGHAAEAVLMYGAAAYLLRTYAGPDMRIRKRLSWLVGLITVNAIVVAFYLGYHWPTDLLGGMIAGGLMLRIIVDVDRWIADRRLRAPATRTAAPVRVAPATAPALPRPALTRAVATASLPGPVQLPELRPAAVCRRSPWERPATSSLLREHPRAHRRRELATSGQG